LLLALLLLLAGPACAGQSILASGARDGTTPAWAVTGVGPEGWTADCCTYARAIGVDAVVYRGEWTGKPERVMVLNVWPARRATLDDELAEDRRQYLQRDPRAKTEDFPARNATLTCKGVLYHGSDSEDDAVVFCDAGKAAGVRLSWSMTVAVADPQHAETLAHLHEVIEASAYMTYVDGTGQAPH
jgi:hypothetical protein